MAELMAIVQEAQSAYSVMFEDDGRVAYAYLREGRKIVSDVWLYNSGATPETPEWTNPDRLPFANPRGFVLSEKPPAVLKPADVSVRWIRRGELLTAVEVYLNGDLYGRLAPGKKPGWARLASREGPLALPLNQLEA